MWWEPGSEREREVADWLYGAEERFSSEEYVRGQVWGVGSYIATGGVRPLALLNEAWVEDEPSPVPRLLSPRLLPSDVQEELRHWEFPEFTVFLIVTEPEPLSNSGSIGVSAGDVLRSPAPPPATWEHGTIGPGVEGYDASGNRLFTGVLTAGHCTPYGQGSAVYIVQQRSFRPPHHHLIGSVIHHSDPAGQKRPSYDVSVVELGTSAHIAGFKPSGIAAVQPPLTQPLLCSMYGGLSGTFHQAGIVGALTSFGNPKGLWKNSWLMLPSSVAQRGDSGSLVSVNSTSEGVGLLVGGSRAVNTPWYLCWYAQDLSSIQSDFLSPYNITIS